jgi:acetate kinase
MNILVLNAGSSSFKASLYRLSKKDLPLDPVVPFWTGEIDWNSTGIAVLKAKTADNSV